MSEAACKDHKYERRHHWADSTRVAEPSFRSLLLRSLIGLSTALALHTRYQVGHLRSSGSAAQTGGHTGWLGQLPATCRRFASRGICGCLAPPLGLAALWHTQQEAASMGTPGLSADALHELELVLCVTENTPSQPLTLHC